MLSLDTRSLGIRNMLACIVACCFLLPTPSLSASAPPTDETPATEAWFVDARHDPISSRMREEAKIVNSDGFSLLIFKHFNGTVWADIALPDWRNQKFHRRRLPVFTVDTNDPHDMSRLHEKGADLFNVRNKEIRLQLYAVPGQPKPGLLRQIMVGDELTMRYFDGLGRAHFTKFSLLGSDDAIALALAVPPIDEPSPNAKAKADKGKKQKNEPRRSGVAFDQTVDNHLVRCKRLKSAGDKNAYRSCQHLFAMCVEKPGQSVSELQACLRGADS